MKRSTFIRRSGTLVVGLGFGGALLAAPDTAALIDHLSATDLKLLAVGKKQVESSTLDYPLAAVVRSIYTPATRVRSRGGRLSFTNQAGDEVSIYRNATGVVMKITTRTHG